MTEKEIQVQIINALHAKKLGYFFTVDNKGTYDPVKKVFRKRSKNSMPAGVSDILGITPDGLFVALEVKTPQRRRVVSDDQKNFLKAILERGGVAGVVTSIDEALSLFGV